jgi:lysophospholipase L1-like esterase
MRENRPLTGRTINMKLPAFLALALTMTACGGGGDTQPPQGVAQAPTKVLVDTYGDSTQWGDVHLGRSPAIAQAELGSGYEISNRGVGSSNTANLLTGDGKNLPWAEQMAQSRANIVVINHAINDHPYPIEQFRDNLASLVNTATARGKRVILETPNPLVPGGSLSALWDLTTFAERVEMVRKVAAGTGAYLCDQNKAMHDANADTLEYMWDGVHPSAKGYQFKGHVLAGCIKAA